MTVIYGLRECGTDEVRYIGRTNLPTSARLKKHKLNALRRYPPKISEWIAHAGEIEVIVLAECEPSQANRVERRIVEQYHGGGHRLTNSHLVPRAA